MNHTDEKKLINSFFTSFPITAIVASELTKKLAHPERQGVSILFLWGRQCPNCDNAKQALLINPQAFQWPDVQWYHCNVYEDSDMATRFSLHGIPVFMVYAHSQKKQLQKPVGRITGWPGAKAFQQAIEEVRRKVQEESLS
ncbi:thioredoxin family protein [Entomobacter blattae]|uniref:Thioredoxin n=1 Tax=Entomobacter blattae TaxID=2762277 RepID=A0A7H1NPG3_9PROT|nr:thioredoxin family protein [Entomobacter blattae]QNT77673.1 hypothetical protein JGUZn3_04230 [Entomobacter blattae]